MYLKNTFTENMRKNKCEKIKIIMENEMGLRGKIITEKSIKTIKVLKEEVKLMGKSVHNEETKKLMEGILKLQSVDECYAFFEDLCTVNELLSLGQRFEVANMLRNHKTYNEVAEATGASTATISRVNRCLNYGTDGYQLVLGRMEEDK